MANKKNPSIPWLQAVTNNRILLFVVVVLGLVVAGQGVALTLLFPLKTIEPVYVEFQHSTNSFVVVERAGRNIRANQALISMFLRSYVSCRETVDKVTEAPRYEHVIAYSNPQVTKVFKELYGNKDKSLYYQEGKKRSVHIISDTPLGANIHQVMMETTDTTDGVDKNHDGQADPLRQEWIITMRYAFYDQHVVLDPRKNGVHLINPTGMQIEEYSIKRLDKGGVKN
ncbi:VirB8/TrbF family protein [Desulfospira joergensenii]|uniref:VirB8/TrbF family protein n=1 Tax=Desulfospira joergensenii TaxID=53329 RepID=UPI0003B3A4A0|nr:VirB8/TrbF family protein [Desulfospira joergensenii]